MSEEFCDLCDVALSLHDGPDSCESAEMRAGVVEMFGRVTR